MVYIKIKQINITKCSQPRGQFMTSDSRIFKPRLFTFPTILVTYLYQYSLLMRCYRDSAVNTTKGNSGVFSIIQML